ncbi:hypothetical protein EXIGLDRAFT_733037 [Exidia glandulosa HHB12029]|uniref:Mitochondrial splicing suppressor 51-like C-terminal domain-containing protein n=1 Tax=Exidia glandulosa HHB12029 TaxID=1314781 RepID=A0A165BDV2_EXIGL|nr:hypothetical protein EXIGLDRAFT_733037 [Exidia glandulosa HHB12029]
MSTLNDSYKREWDRVQNDEHKIAKGLPPAKRTCASCGRPCGLNPTTCAGCKALFYCSTRCRTMGRQPMPINATQYKPGHDDAECANIKACMSLKPQLKAIGDQFPWACYDESGRFVVEVAKASRDLLTAGGYWSECNDPRCNDDPCASNLVTHGALPVEASGWHLPVNETPWLGITDEGKAHMKIPDFPPAFEDSWTSYYAWRKLPMSSPAALCLHWALSFYVCLRELGLVELSPSLDAPRRKLKVDCVGPARELGVLSTFGELALLLPNTDLEIKMISLEAHASVKRMRGNYEKFPEFFSYTAPAASGGGSVRIVFHALTKQYDPLRNTLFTNPSTRPDAVIALLGGLGRYPDEWLPVTTACIQHGVPFAVTEFCEQSLTASHKHVRMGLREYIPHMEPHLTREAWYAEALERAPSWKVNQFMRPGMTDSPPFSDIPYGENAFVYVVSPSRA